MAFSPIAKASQGLLSLLRNPKKKEEKKTLGPSRPFGPTKSKMAYPDAFMRKAPAPGSRPSLAPLRKKSPEPVKIRSEQVSASFRPPGPKLTKLRSQELPKTTLKSLASNQGERGGMVPKPAPLKSALDALRPGAQINAALVPRETKPDQMGMLRAELRKLRGVSPEEQQAQSELTNLRESAQLGISGLEGQGRGIPLSLIRGQQSKLAEQANIREQTLINRLAIAQANREAARQAVVQELGFAEQDEAQERAEEAAQFQAQGTFIKEQADLLKPIQVDGRLVQYNPSSGVYEEVFAPEVGSVGVKPVTLSRGQQLIDPTTGEILAANLISEGSGENDRVLNFSEAQQLGVPVGTRLSQVMGRVIDPKLTDAQQKARVFARRIEQSNPTIDRFAEKFSGSFSKLPNLERFKSEDRKLFEQAERDFINAVLRRESGAVISPSEFVEARLQYMPAPGDTPAVLEKKSLAREIILEELQSEGKIRSIERSQPQTVDDFLDSFSNDPSTSIKGSLPNFKAAIARQESGGRYNAIGPETSKGNRAYGKYQVMDFNIPNWTRQALGVAMTPQQFLNNPDAQETVAEFKFTELFNKHQNWADVASVWFSGRPLAQAGNASDVTGTTVPRYVQNILNFMG